MASRETDDPLESDLSRERLEETRPSMLESIHGQLERALKGSIGEAEFVRNMEINLKTFGWWGVSKVGSPQGLRTIFHTNRSAAWGHARYHRHLDNADSRPYWQYDAVMDAHTRKSHAAMDGRVFRFDDPIWDTHYPLNGWNCRCHVRALTEKEVKARGLVISDSAGSLSHMPLEVRVNKRTGEVITTQGTSYSFATPDGKRHTMTPGPGWNCNPAQFGPEFDLLSTLDRTLRMFEVAQACY